MEVGKVIKRGEGEEVRTFFFFFFFFLLFSFENDGNLFLGLPKWKFSTGKKHFTPGKKSGKMTLPPQKSMPVTPLKKIHLYRLHTLPLALLKGSLKVQKPRRLLT